MSLLDSVFGAGAQQAMLGNNIGQTQQQANTAFTAAYNQYSSQQQASLSQAFNQKMMNWNQNPYANQSPHQWVFNSKPCTIHEFADAIWGQEDHEDKMLFLLAHSGPEQK